MAILLIVGTLVAAAAPLYSPYLKKSKITEAFNIMGAIISSEMLQTRRFPSRVFYAANTKTAFMATGLDLSETIYFTYEVATDEATPATTFTVTARATSRYRDNPDACFIRYIHNPSTSPVGQCSCD
jgi:Tfp pilus assembly protein PilE